MYAEILTTTLTVVRRWIAKYARPISMGENDKPFRQFIRTITFGRYLPPCAMTVTSELINEYAETQAQMKEDLAKYMKGGLVPCITTDIWREDGNNSRHSVASLLAVDAHYVVLWYADFTDVRLPYVVTKI